MKERTGFIIFGGVLILVLALVFYVIIVSHHQSNKGLNICATEYGFEERGIWDGGIWNLNYKTSYVNRTHFACCLKNAYLSNGEVRSLNCTSIYDRNEIFANQGNDE